jgi:hypothetical protein
MEKIFHLTAIPLIIQNDSIFWADEIISTSYGFDYTTKGTQRGLIIGYGRYAPKGVDPIQKGERKVTLIIPNDEHLTGNVLSFQMWLVDVDEPRIIPFRISSESDRDTYLFWETTQQTSFVLAIVSLLILLWLIFRRTGKRSLLTHYLPRLREK